MAKRHEHRSGDWESVAIRLDEILRAHSGEDPFDEALKLLVAKLASEVLEGPQPGFLVGRVGSAAASEVDRLLEVAAERWPGILEPRAVTRLREPELRRSAQLLRSVRLVADDLVGLDAIFEHLVSHSAKGEKGQFFTPRHVIAEVVAMMHPRRGEAVVDPACGSGGFLRHCLRHEPDCSVWGFDHDPRASRVARVMMAASGKSTTRIGRVDSLRRVSEPRGQPAAATIEQWLRAHEPSAREFDLVLTNPPFAGDVGAEYAAEYELARGRRVERDVLFVERCVELLRPGGRLAIVMPHNKVGGATWGPLRRWLLERVRVVAVIGLGRNTFLPHTSQKACVLLGVKRARPTGRFRVDEILFFISQLDGKDHRGRSVRGPGGRAVEHDLAEATPLVRERFERLAAGGG